jgi:6-phosphogluconolactonase (cycloisomerase 2 family)
VTPATGALKLVSTADLPANTAITTAVALNPAGTLMFVPLGVVCCGSGTPQRGGLIATYSIDSAGNLALLQTGGVASGTDLATTPTGLVVNPAGSFLYAMSYNLGNQQATISQFAIQASGELVPLSNLSLASGGTVGLAMTPDGKTLYAEMYNGPEVVAFAVDPTTGKLTQQETQNCGCFAGWGGGIQVNATGTMLFEATAGESLAVDGVVAFSIDPSTGALTPLPKSFISVNSDGAPTFVLDSSGLLLYTTGPGVIDLLGYSIGAGGAATPVPGSPFAGTGGGSLLMVNYQP